MTKVKKTILFFILIFFVLATILTSIGLLAFISFPSESSTETIVTTTEEVKNKDNVREGDLDDVFEQVDITNSL